MNIDCIRNAQRILQVLCLSALFSAAPAFAKETARAHTDVLSAAGEKKCQTACHQPENLRHAREGKSRDNECRQCHSPSLPALPPFTLADLGRAPATTDKPRSLQLASAKKKSSGGPANKTTPPNMAYVDAGEFIMGTNDRWDDESPEYVEKTGAYFIDLYEVTNQDYKKFVDAARHAAPYHWPEGKIPAGKENHPVTYVSWFDADAYCKWTGKRLPTEEEWEKAARGNDGRIYPWGNKWDPGHSNNPYKGSTGTQPVGSYPQGKSPYGLFDMSGNVWEWVDSYYLPHPGNTKASAEYGKDKRILKGGSWFDCLSYGCGLSAPSFNRSFFTPEVRNNSFGFRCAKSP